MTTLQMAGLLIVIFGVGVALINWLLDNRDDE